MGDSEQGERILGPPAKVGLLFARADLAYVRAAIEGGHVERGLAFLQHAVLVAFEAHAFCTRQLGLTLPQLAWSTELAAASRTSGKLFDDSRRDLTLLTRDVGQLAEATRLAFTGGWRRRLARSLGVWNPDLSVLSVQGIPVSTNVTMAFHAAAQVPGPENVAATGRVMHDLAQGVGQMVSALGAADDPHIPPAADLDETWSWADGDSEKCYTQAFAGEVGPKTVPMLLLMQGAAATAALLASTDCCDDCRLAAFKHRLIVAHHVVRSLAIFRTSEWAGPAAGARVDALLEDPDVRRVHDLRALRNGLVHLGLSDVSTMTFEASDPARAVIEHYASGLPLETVEAFVVRALDRIHGGLTGWLLESPRDGVGLVALLRLPAD